MAKPSILTDGHQRAGAAFRSHFGASPHMMIRSPGRVLLVGEHTDHQEGCALAMALDRSQWLALRPRTDGQVILHSVEQQDVVQFSVIEPEPKPVAWREYVRGVAWAVREAGWPVRGWEGCVASDLPLGAGLASSTALALAVARAFAETAVQPWDPATAVACVRRAEAEWVNAACGVMDPWPGALAKRGSALLLDARARTSQPVPMPRGYTVVLLDAGRHATPDASLDGQRKDECRVAAQRMDTPSLRDMDVTRFAGKAPHLDELSKRRARYVVTENSRVQQAVQAMQRGDGDGLGIILNMSHASLRDDFDLSDPLLEQLVRTARAIKGCAGARALRGPAGGVTLALVNNWALSGFLEQIGPVFQSQTGVALTVMPTAAAAGLSLA